MVLHQTRRGRRFCHEVRNIAGFTGRFKPASLALIEFGPEVGLLIKGRMYVLSYKDDVVGRGIGPCGL